MTKHFIERTYLYFLLLAFFSCNDKKDFKQFNLIKGDEVGINFINTITESDSLNPVLYTYIYNGAGVGVADINNDGLQDIYFAGNQVSGKLYLNKGNFQFEDITESAGLETDRWCTGVAMVDINTDGFTDIYICVADRNYTEKGRNLLYINNGDNTFTESAKSFGLDDPMYSTQAAFLDYDLDGDLDLYLLNNGIEDIPPNNTRPIKTNGKGISTDRLYRNNAIECAGGGLDTADCSRPFLNVSTNAGITIEGYGLGIAVADINKDGYPDIYCANDFITNDLLWINNGDGTFSDQVKSYTGHTTYNGMGIDIADFNNDMLPDIVEMDMLPEDNLHTKSMLMPMNYDNYQLKLRMGYHPQFVRNTLQLNLGNNNFGEIARMAGVHRTDWSWAPLLVDMDNDGLRDLFISNGYGRDITDLDFVVYGMQNSNSFSNKRITDEEEYEKMKKLPGIYLSNYFYKNKGVLVFEDKTADWDIKTPSYSNGSAFADLDNDGDLDFIVNNINAHPFIYKNRQDEKFNEEKKTYLRLKLNGPPLNPAGWGAKIQLNSANHTIYHEHYVMRGYKSTVENIIHFGLDTDSTDISLRITWPDGKEEQIDRILANQVLEINYNNAYSKDEEQLKTLVENPLLENMPHDLAPAFKHTENDFNDFKEQPLLHQMHSRTGPGIAVADVNGDGLSDFFIGGAADQGGKLFIQKNDFQFVSSILDETSIKLEDTGCLFFDADNDGDQDLYVASGGALFFTDGEFRNVYQDRLYINDGHGNFKQDSAALPEVTGSAAGVHAADFDQDGDLDLFVAGKFSPKKYPESGKNYLLENRGGNFIDITLKVDGLRDIGMVSSALWTDVDSDGWQDLIMVGEWMPFTVFQNDKGKLKNITNSTNVANLTGWWNSIVGGDFDADGDIDYIAGNLGLNSVLKASETEPMELFAKDFDRSGNIDPVLFSYIQGQSYPVAMRDALIDQINAMKGRFKLYKTYGEATINNVFTEGELADAVKLSATTLAHSYFQNEGEGKFKVVQLPNIIQIAPVFGMHVSDFNNDGYLDVFTTGNNTNVETLYGYYDASPGILLLGDGKGKFKALPTAENKVDLKGNIRSLVEIRDAQEQFYLLAGNNNGKLATVIQNTQPTSSIILENDDASAQLFFEDSQKNRKVEFYYGEGYFSQNERILKIPSHVSKVIIKSFTGESREVKIE